MKLEITVWYIEFSDLTQYINKKQIWPILPLNINKTQTMQTMQTMQNI